MGWIVSSTFLSGMLIIYLPSRYVVYVRVPRYGVDLSSRYFVDIIVDSPSIVVGRRYSFQVCCRSCRSTLHACCGSYCSSSFHVCRGPYRRSSFHVVGLIVVLPSMHVVGLIVVLPSMHVVGVIVVLPSMHVVGLIVVLPSMHVVGLIVDRSSAYKWIILLILFQGMSVVYLTVDFLQ